MLDVFGARAVLAGLRALSHQLHRHEDTMTAATNALNAKIDDLTGAVTDALAEIDREVATIRANASATDDTAEVNAAADRIAGLTGRLRDGLAAAHSDLTTAADAAVGGGVAQAPASASSAAPVPLAGVPETPVPAAGLASTGPAVPSTDHAETEPAPVQAQTDAQADRA